MADKQAKPAKQAKGKKGAAAGAATSASIRAHPRARTGIRRARSRAGLGLFVLVLVFGLRAGLTPFDATWRGLLAGLAAYLIAWRCAIIVWRHVIISELRQAEAAYAERRRVARERLEAEGAERRAVYAKASGTRAA